MLFISFVIFFIIINLLIFKFGEEGGRRMGGVLIHLSSFLQSDGCGQCADMSQCSCFQCPLSQSSESMHDLIMCICCISPSYGA